MCISRNDTLPLPVLFTFGRVEVNVSAEEVVQSPDVGGVGDVMASTDRAQAPVHVIPTQT